MKQKLQKTSQKTKQKQHEMFETQKRIQWRVKTLEFALKKMIDYFARLKNFNIKKYEIKNKIETQMSWHV